MEGELLRPDQDEGSSAVRPDIELDELAIRVRPMVERYVANRVRKPDHREEIVSRVFEALARSWGSFRHDCPADAFVVKIASNAVKNYYERDLAKQSRQISLEIWCEEFCLQQMGGVSGPHQEVHLRDEVESLLREMQKACSPMECAVVELVYQGHTMDEIGTLLELNAATVRSHFLRGRERLLAHLLVEAPDLLGGVDAVNAVVVRLGDGLTGEEAEAIRLRKGPAGLLRRAMLKVAPYLGVVAWLMVGGRR